MKFKQLSEYFARIEETTLRNEKMSILAELLGKVEEKEIAQVVYLALGRLRPKYDRLEFSLAEKMIVRVVARVVNKSVEEVTEEYKEKGDFSKLLVLSSKFSADCSMQVGEVYGRLENIARESGTGSQERKVEGLHALLVELDYKSAGYVVRIVLTKLRLGFSDKTVLDALSYMQYESKEGRKILDSAYQAFPDVGRIAEVVKDSGIEELPKLIGITMGTPVMSALAQRVKTADEMIEKMGEVVCEPKFDGQRVQIHFSKNKPACADRVSNIAEERSELTDQGGLFQEEEKKVWVRTFTRNLDENSHMFPELERIGDELDADEVILDTEAVGYDSKTGEMLPFQMTIKRKRKHGIFEVAKEVPLRFYVFDIMYLDGESLLDMSLLERRKVLQRIVRDNGEVLILDDYLVTSDPHELREYHALQLGKGLEGAMVKKVNGKYLPGRQDYNWVKFKESEDSEAKLSDTLDVVIMGYYKGRGKRAKFGMGAFLVGVRKGEEIVTIAKVGTGITDVEFGELMGKLEKIEIDNPREEYVVEKILTPDVWVEPSVVVEVAADEITKSPAHSSGMALRFPRLIRFRDDKDLEGVTSVEEVREIGE